jgi:Family of unknown function (DUF5681)
MSKQKRENHTVNATPCESDVSSGMPGKGQYQVGYGCPPIHTRFKPGESGNPSGRPAGRPNAKTTVARVINEKVAVREGQKTRNMTKLEAVVQAHAMKAMKGDARSASIVIGLVIRMGLLGEQEDETLAASPQEDAAIVNDFLRRSAGSEKSDALDAKEHR